MMADQWECSVVMIEGHIGPAAWVVTRSAICAKLAVVGISGRMAAITIFWRSLIHIVGMT